MTGPRQSPPATERARGRSRAPAGSEPAGSEPAANLALDAAVAKVGDRWTLLVVDALLEAPRRFKDLAEALPGLAPNVLIARLRRLESDGLVSTVPYSKRPPRFEYRVTDQGRQLAGAMRLLAGWGARSAGVQVEAPRHRSCGTALEARWYCPTCGRVADHADDGVEWL